MAPSVPIDREEILEGIRGWVEIETPTIEPEAVNQLVTKVENDYLALGATTERIPGRDGFGDLLKVRTPWGGDKPGLLVLAHLDTVHPLGTLEHNLRFRVEGDRAYGPGIYDMKGGGYLGFYAFQQFRKHNLETPLPITFLYNSDEELSSQSSRPVIEEEARKARYVLVLEPAREGGKVVTARKGSARFNIRITGRPSHSGSKHAEGRSAIKELARQIIDLEAMTDYDTGLTVNVGVISGGTRPNVIPETATAMVDMRVPTAEIADEAVVKVLSLKPYDPDVKVEVTGELKRPPYERLPHNIEIFEHAKRLAAEIGFELRDLKTGGGSDGNFTASTIPTLDGMGVDGAGAHTFDEHLLVSSLEPRATLVIRLMETLS
jgi:glutamate carboxypeptidase